MRYLSSKALKPRTLQTLGETTSDQGISNYILTVKYVEISWKCELRSQENPALLNMYMIYRAGWTNIILYKFKFWYLLVGPTIYSLYFCGHTASSNISIILFCMLHYHLKFSVAIFLCLICCITDTWAEAMQNWHGRVVLKGKKQICKLSRSFLNCIKQSLWVTFL